MEKELHLVGFRVGRETFGVPIAMVREIVRLPEITAVPNAAEFIEGVINLRGKIVPVVDLRKRFKDVAIENGRKSRILVAEVEGQSVGLIVNSASEVLKIPPADVEVPRNLFSEGELSYISGVGKLNGRLILILDLNKVLQRGELRSAGEVAEVATLEAAGAMK
ncbi:MAG TPA: chemotaxis protein CheW [Candidatus Acidoferrales bacterium]|nr:chemotaxis protein CheW [Candidatus Acidoferrales bacterium]